MEHIHGRHIAPVRQHLWVHMGGRSGEDTTEGLGLYGQF